jgi:hypothetical protein
MPAPVIVMKVGGFVPDYQSQTANYRASEHEVRLHECRSACTRALGLPNVCVYPGSVLKFHLAYDPRNHRCRRGGRQMPRYPPCKGWRGPHCQKSLPAGSIFFRQDSVPMRT